MMYAVLCYHAEDAVMSWTKEEDDAVMAKLTAVVDKHARNGKVGPVARLLPTTAATTLRSDRNEPLVIDGPFAETKELIAGFWLWQVRSMEEAIEWVKRCPNPTGEEAEIEVRPVFEAEDFGPEFTPELRQQEERLRAEIEKQTAVTPGRSDSAGG